MYAHGSRFFVNGSNAVAVFSSYDHLVELLTKYKKSSISAAQLLKMMNDNQLYSQLAVMARLSSFVHNIWSMVTVKQSKRNLVDNIKHLQTQMEMIESNTFSLDEVVDSLSRNSEVDRDAHQKYVAEFSNNLEIQTKTREVFLHFSGKIIDLMEPYLEIEDSHSMDAETDHLDTIIDPTNLSIERAFGLMKFYERRFIQLSFGCLSALTIAKFNDLPRWLPAFNDDELLQAHDSVSTNQSLSRDVHAIQQNHMQVNTEKSLNQVIIIDIEKIFIFSFQLIIKQTTVADKLDSGVEIVLKNRRLIPMPDLSDVDVRRSEFNKMRKQSKLLPFGSEYVVNVFSTY